MKVGNKKKQVTFSVRLTIHHVSAAVVWCVVFLLELHKKKPLGRIKKPTIACYKNQTPKSSIQKFIELII